MPVLKTFFRVLQTGNDAMSVYGINRVQLIGKATKCRVKDLASYEREGRQTSLQDPAAPSVGITRGRTIKPYTKTAVRNIRLWPNYHESTPPSHGRGHFSWDHLPTLPPPTRFQ